MQTASLESRRIRHRDRIDVRRFNRFYTKQIGALQEGLLDSPFSLAEARILYEIAHRDRPTATDAQTLGLDAGYLSRMLRAFEKRALVKKTRSAEDGPRKLAGADCRRA